MHPRHAMTTLKNLVIELRHRFISPYHEMNQARAPKSSSATSRLSLNQK